MQGLKRKIVHSTLFEVIAVLCTSAGLALLGHDLGHAGVAAVVSSALAMVWNMAYNSLFEMWEARQATRGRSALRRVVHALGFEGGLVLVLAPFFAWWLGVTLVQALVVNLGLVAFFVIYGLVFNLAFDRMFGLPKSAQPA
jgi:uncharacterized membrane protein